MIAKMMEKGNGPGEHPMIDAAFGTLVLPGTSLAGEAALPALALTLTSPILPLQ